MAELQREFAGVETRLVPSSGGVFVVTVDGTMVFSKKAEGRHALPGEVAARIRVMRG